MDHAGFKADAEVLIKTRPQIGVPLRLVSAPENAHLRLVFGSARDARRCPVGQTGIRRGPELE